MSITSSPRSTSFQREAATIHQVVILSEAKDLHLLWSKMMLKIARCVVIAMTTIAPHLHAQDKDADTKAAIAVADSVLIVLTNGDSKTLTRLTLDSAVVGGIGSRAGVERMSLRT